MKSGILAVAGVVLALGCSEKPSRPFAVRLAALERGDSPTSVFVDLFEVPYVRESARDVDDSVMPKRYPPVAGRFARPISPRGLALDVEPKFDWLQPNVGSDGFLLMLWDGVDGAAGGSIANEKVPSSPQPSPRTLERGKTYFWGVLDPSNAAGAQVPFAVADEASAVAMREAAGSLERTIKDRETSLLLRTNLFESRGYFGEASLLLLELWRLHPKSDYLVKRAQRLSLYL